MKRKMIAKTAVAMLLGAAALSASPVFAESVNATLNVTGTVTPGSCTVSFVGGGAIDYGTIASANLSATAYTALTEKTKNLSVVCGSNTNAYVSVIDNRSASVVKDSTMKTALGNGTLGDTQVFGLGNAGSSTVGVGAYTIKIGQATVTDTAGTSTTAPAVLSSTDKSAWTASTSPVFLTTGTSQYYSAGPSGSGAVPVKGKTFVFPLTVKAALNNTTNMPVSSNVALDGSATFTVSYN